MKKNKYILFAIIWLGVAALCFFRNKLVVGIPWLVIGFFNLAIYIKACKMERMSREITEKLNRIQVENIEENDPHNAVIDPIEILNEEHIIQDEYIGYGYVVDKAFKAAKSHAAEAELLCTYAPNDEYGCEGAIPYIAVQIDDVVYCAIDEYKRNKSFEGAIALEPLEGMFMFRAKKEYYDDMMYFYGVELDESEYWDMAGLCLVYPKEYVGTENEEILMQVLDKAAQSFQECK